MEDLEPATEYIIRLSSINKYGTSDGVLLTQNTRKGTGILLFLCCRYVFAWEHVNMVVTARCFAFHVLVTQARIWKSFLVENSTSLLYLPIPLSDETWKIFTNTLCQFFFFAYADILSKSVFWNASFLQNKNWLRLQNFATGKNFSINQCHHKEFRVFSRES